MTSRDMSIDKITRRDVSVDKITVEKILIEMTLDKSQ